MAWATLAQFKANQVNLAGDNSAAANAQITLSLNATGSQITSCLDNGGYSTSAIKVAIVAGAIYDLLVLLNIRLAALDLMAGGGTAKPKAQKKAKPKKVNEKKPKKEKKKKGK